MQPPIDVANLSANAQRILDPKGPPPVRLMAARGVSPGLKPWEALTVIALLAEGSDEKAGPTARETLANLPGPLLSGAMVPELPTGLIADLVPRYAHDAIAMQRFLVLPQILPETVADAAARASEMVAELIATNEERLLKHPEIIEKLYMNKATRMSTADRLLELAVRHKLKLSGIPAFEEAAAEIVNQLVAEASAERTFDDILFHETAAIAESLPLDLSKEDTHKFDEIEGKEILVEKFVSLEAKLRDMTITQKIRRAMLGTPSERAILVRDSNKNIARAAIKSPLMQENEVVRIAASRNVSDEVLSIIARSREFTRSYQVKLNLVTNPRTPFTFVAKLVAHLFDHDLKKLAGSKNVTGQVSQAARQQLARKKKKNE